MDTEIRRQDRHRPSDWSRAALHLCAARWLRTDPTLDDRVVRLHHDLHSYLAYLPTTPVPLQELIEIWLPAYGIHSHGPYTVQLINRKDPNVSHLTIIGIPVEAQYMVYLIVDLEPSLFDKVITRIWDAACALSGENT